MSAKTATLSRPRTLICACCGNSTRGRQWWNRDHGYGICGKCADWQATRENATFMRSCYGERGVHYAIPTEPEPQQLPAFRVHLSDGDSYVTSMAIGITINEARAYFIGQTNFADLAETIKRTVVDVTQVAGGAA